MQVERSIVCTITYCKFGKPKGCSLSNSTIKFPSSCAGSGVAGDLASAARVLEKQLEMLHFNINRRKVRVNCAKHLSKELLAAQKGRLMVSFVIAGVDPTGICLYSVNFDGTSTTVLFVSIGSGHYGAMSILENRWHLDMNECEARQLMVDAISGGINNDLCSGSSLEVLIVRTDYTVERFTETIHNSKRDCKKEVLPPILGGTSVTHTKFVELEVTDEKVHKLPPIAPSLPLLPIQSNELRLTFDDRRRARKRSASTDLTHSTEKKPRLK